MRNCIVCGGNRKETLFDSSVNVPQPYPLSGKQYIIRCIDCGFIYGDSDNTDTALADYYTSLNKHKKRATDAKDLDRMYFEKILRFMDPISPDAAILDFGSGDLLMQSVLREKGYKDILTYDIDTDDDFQDKFSKFDLLISTHTFEHILHADKTLQKLKKYLKNGAELLLAVPNVEGYADCYYGPYNCFDLEHINHFSPVSLKNFLRVNGFTVTKTLVDKREVRPNLFYPEVVVQCRNHPSEHSESNIIYEKDNSERALREYLDESAIDFQKTLRTLMDLRGKKIIMWGIGILAMRLLHHAGAVDAEFVDSDARLWGKKLCGKDILSPDTLNGIDLEKTVFVVAAVNSGDIVKAIRKIFGEKVKIKVLSPQAEITTRIRYGEKATIRRQRCMSI